jgi:DNA-binding NarL/FixJ family response regulator
MLISIKHDQTSDRVDATDRARSSKRGARERTPDRGVILLDSDDWPVNDGAGRTLTRRELEIVRLVSQGLTNKVVAGELGVREGTVKIHLHNIFRKLRVSSRTELILRVIANGRKFPKFKGAAS